MFEGRTYAVREEPGFGSGCGVYAESDDEPFLHAAQERFAIKEDFRFADPESGEEVLWVKAESALDAAAAYDVIDERTGEYVGSVARNVVSVLKHSYEVRDHSGDLLATIEETGWVRALLRRQVTDALPFTYHIEGPDGERYGEISESFGIRDEYEITLEPGDATADAEGVEASAALDPRLAVVAIVVIDEIEGI